MKFTVREILDRVPGSTLSYLCQVKGISTRGPVDDRRSALTQAYGRHVSHLLQDLRRSDLSKIFRRAIEFDGRTYRLRNRVRYAKAELLQFAMEFFVYESVPDTFTRESGDEDDEDDVEEGDDEAQDEDGPEESDGEEEEEEAGDDGDELPAALQRLLEPLRPGIWSRSRTVGRLLEICYERTYERLRTTRFHQLLADLDRYGIQVSYADDDTHEPLALDADAPRLETELRLRWAGELVLSNPPSPHWDQPTLFSNPSSPSESPPAPSMPVNLFGKEESRPRSRRSPEFAQPLAVVPDPPRQQPVASASRPVDYELALLRLEFLTAVPFADRVRDPHWPEAFLDAATRGLELDDRSRRFLGLAAKSFASGSHDPMPRVVRLARVLRPDEWPLLLIDFERLNPDADPETIALTLRHAEELASLPQDLVLPSATRAQTRREEQPSFAASGKSTARPHEKPSAHRDLGALKKMFED